MAKEVSMRAWFQVGCLVVLLAGLSGCMALDVWGKEKPAPGTGPRPEEMRQALLTMLNERPDLEIPEFRVSLEKDAPVDVDGVVHIGDWKCNSDYLSFTALFSAPNITMYEVSGSFEKDARGIWRAIPRRVMKTRNRDIQEFWRPNEWEQ
jgi:hypothetical protein